MSQEEYEVIGKRMEVRFKEVKDISLELNRTSILLRKWVELKMDNKLKTAEELMKLIAEFDEETKQKVLDRIYDEYFLDGGATRYNVKEK